MVKQSSASRGEGGLATYLVLWVSGILVFCVLSVCTWHLMRPDEKSVAIGKYEVTRNVVRSLLLAISSYAAQEGGAYPWILPGNVYEDTSIDGYHVVRAIKGHARRNGGRGELDSIPKSFLVDGCVVDAWGNPLIVRVDPHSLMPVVWSCGPNQIDETNDGVTPDARKMPQGCYLYEQGSTGDDVVAR